MLNTFDALEVIMTLLASGLMGSVCGLFSYFLDYTFWPESINKWYLPWLACQVLKKRNVMTYAEVVRLRSVKGNWQEYAVDMAGKYGWYKVLGGCSVCFNIWLATISWTVICVFTPFAWYYGFAYVMVSSAVIRKKVGAVYQ